MSNYMLLTDSKQIKCNIILPWADPCVKFSLLISYYSTYWLFTIASLDALFFDTNQSSFQRSNDGSSTAYITWWSADYIRQGLKSSRLYSIYSKQQLVELLQSYYRTNDADLQQTTTPASSDGVAPMPASDYLTYQHDELKHKCRDNWDGNQTNQQMTQGLQLD